MILEPIESKHFDRLFEITAATQPHTNLSREQFEALYSARMGFVLVHKDEVIGHITFSDYSKDCDVMIHCSVVPEYQKRWLSRTIYKQVFDFVFEELNCVRASGFALNGINDLKFHERLGFSLEGIFPKAVSLNGQYLDVYRYGMLKEKRRW